MKTTAEMTLGSLFDGIAGFPLAARRQGIKTVWVSEIEPDCIDIAKRHFPEALQLGDITQIDGAKIPVVDIISFGSPCQDLSVAGKQTGLDGSRSGLFMEAVRITREMREKTNGQYPKYIIWENVAGAFSSNKGEDFRRVLEEITQSNISMPKSGKWATAGMVGNEGPGGDVQCTAWRLLDAQFWGVPQRRKRIYLVNDFGNGRAGQILFECESVLGYHSQGRDEEQGNSGNSENSLTGTDCRGMAEDADGQMKLDFGRTADRIYINAKTSPTLMSQHRPAVVYGYTQSGYGEFKEGVGTLKKSRGAAGGGSETIAVIMERIAAAVKYRVRRLTPLECERLDGFPDEWTRYGASGKEMSDNARYMALGNSIAVPCAERVFIGIKKAESEE
jgi:DNA (cytosine-5)-methyltransferase 1